MAVREWAYRSVIASSDIPLGTEIEISHLCTKRPGTGIPSKDYKSLIGKKTPNMCQKYNAEMGRF